MSVYITNKNQDAADLVTVENCDTKSLLEITHDLNNRKTAISENKDVFTNRKNFFAKYIPTLYII